MLFSSIESLLLCLQSSDSSRNMVVFGNVSAANLPYQNGFLEALTSGGCEIMGRSFRITTSQSHKTRTRRRSSGGPLQVPAWFCFTSILGILCFL